VTTAARLSETLEVSERTVYRDIADLMASGVPIRGEAGVGYAIEAGYDLPPLMFSIEEIEALVLGARMVRSWCGEELAAAADEAVARLEQALPRRLRDRLAPTALFVPDFGWSVPGSELLGDLRVALRASRKVWIAYRDVKERTSERMLRPLGLFFWGAKTTLAAWCELRQDFRNFRVDRISSLELRPETFDAEPGRSLQDYYRAMADQHRQGRDET